MRATGSVLAGADAGWGYGVFKRLSMTHLIPAARLSRPYFVRLIHDHAFAHCILRYRLEGVQPRRIDRFRYVRLLLHGLRNGPFSLRCQWAARKGEERAARFIAERQWQPSVIAGVPSRA